MIKNPVTKNIKKIKNKKRNNIVIFLNNTEYQNSKMTDIKFISNKSLIENSINYINKNYCLTKFILSFTQQMTEDFMKIILKVSKFKNNKKILEIFYDTKLQYLMRV